MAALDAVRNGPHDDGHLDDAGAESPARPTMQPGEHLGPQFGAAVKTTSDKPRAAWHPHRVGRASVHQYLSGRTNPRERQ